MNSLETETETENDNDYVLIEEKTSSKKRKMKFLESIPTDFKDDDEQSAQTPSKKLVLYENDTGYASDTKIESPYSIKSLSKHLRGAKSIGAFTAQCSECFNWRLIPTIEKYEQIRENLSGNPFICERAEEWGRKVSCVDPSDINQDGSRIWAIDKPNIARTPQGWERLLKIRGEGSTRFADVYVFSLPSFISIFYICQKSTKNFMLPSIMVIDAACFFSFSQHNAVFLTRKHVGWLHHFLLHKLHIIFTSLAE